MRTILCIYRLVAGNRLLSPIIFGYFGTEEAKQLI